MKKETLAQVEKLTFVFRGIQLLTEHSDYDSSNPVSRHIHGLCWGEEAEKALKDIEEALQEMREAAFHRIRMKRLMKGNK